jgi:hypothetical protein
MRLRNKFVSETYMRRAQTHAIAFLLLIMSAGAAHAETCTTRPGIGNTAITTCTDGKGAPPQQYRYAPGRRRHEHHHGQRPHHPPGGRRRDGNDVSIESVMSKGDVERALAVQATNPR